MTTTTAQSLTKRELEAHVVELAEQLRRTQDQLAEVQFKAEGLAQQNEDLLAQLSEVSAKLEEATKPRPKRPRLPEWEGLVATHLLRGMYHKGFKQMEAIQFFYALVGEEKMEAEHKGFPGTVSTQFREARDAGPAGEYARLSDEQVERIRAVISGKKEGS